MIFINFDFLSQAYPGMEVKWTQFLPIWIFHSFWSLLVYAWELVYAENPEWTHEKARKQKTYYGRTGMNSK